MWSIFFVVSQAADALLVDLVNNWLVGSCLMDVFGRVSYFRICSLAFYQGLYDVSLSIPFFAITEIKLFFREFHFSFARQRSMKAAFLVFSLILSIRATRVVTRLSFRIVLAEPSTRT